jgi:catechol 2,3-dioxygenase-like lactoylglutathione lyase family enzyme
VRTEITMPRRSRLDWYVIALTAACVAAVLGSTSDAGPLAASHDAEPAQRPLSSYGETSAGIPGARNPDHFGVVVPNLDEAIRFFTTVLGADLLWTAGPFTDPKNNPPRYDVDARATSRVAMVRLGPNVNFELKEASFPDQVRTFPRNADVGSPHIAFYVDDLEAASAYLKAKGVRLLEGPFKPGGEAKKGEEIRYFQTPFGMYMELVHRPASIPYEQQTPARLYGPARSWKQDRAWAR